MIAKMLNAVVLSLLLACPAIADTNVADVTCAELGFSRSAEQRDRSAFRAFIDNDARFVGAGVMVGPAAVIAAWEPFFADGGPQISWRPLIVEVVREGDLALSRGTYKIDSINAEGDVQTVWGTFNSVWRKTTDGDWKVLFDMGGDHGKDPSAEEMALFERESECLNKPAG